MVRKSKKSQQGRDNSGLKGDKGLQTRNFKGEAVAWGISGRGKVVGKVESLKRKGIQKIMGRGSWKSQERCLGQRPRK